MNRADIENWYRDLQTRFCEGIEAVDGSTSFRSDVWDRPGGGGGDTRILSGGDHIEKAAVNFSAVWGDAPAELTERTVSQGIRFTRPGCRSSFILVILTALPFMPICATSRPTQGCRGSVAAPTSRRITSTRRRPPLPCCAPRRVRRQ